MFYSTYIFIIVISNYNVYVIFTFKNLKVQKLKFQFFPRGTWNQTKQYGIFHKMVLHRDHHG